MSTAILTSSALPAIPARTTSAGRIPLALTILVVGTAFLLVEHNFRASLRTNFQITLDEMEEVADGGNAVRRIAFFALAGMGLLLCCLPSRSRFHISPLPALCIGFYLGWCTLSVFWSIDPSMTIRRILVVWCCVFGAAGIARQFSLRDWMLLCLILNATMMAYGVASEVLLGTFRPWAGDYRFSGTLHPNLQGLNGAMTVLSAFCLAKAERRRRMLYVALLLFGLCFLVLTKSRTALGGTLLAMGMIWTIRTPLGFKLLVALSGAWFLSLVLFVVMTAGMDLADEFTQAMLLGRQEEAGTLTGRIPIWTELAPKIRQRFLIGYGFEAYWTPDHIEEMTEEVEWAVMEAHSSYLESMLSVGLLGTSAFIMGAFFCMVLSASRFLRTSQPGYDLLFGLCIFGFVNAFTESGMSAQLMFTFLLGSGLLQLSFFAPLAGGYPDPRVTLPASQHAGL